MSNQQGIVPPSAKALKEAMDLAEEALKDLELSRLPLTNVALKTTRVARLLNNTEMELLFRYEASGYPMGSDGFVPQDAWNLACKAGRKFTATDPKTKQLLEYVYRESIEEIEQQIETNKSGLAVSNDPSISVSSANPNQYVMPSLGNTFERQRYGTAIQTATHRLTKARSVLHAFLTAVYNQLRFSGIASDVFSRIRQSGDSLINRHLSQSIQKFTAVYENLASDNPEDWSNAVHGCRRVLEDLADAVFPPQRAPFTRSSDGKPIQVGKAHYGNRLVCFVDQCSGSSTYLSVVKASISYLSALIESCYGAANKGTHDTINTRSEADRYVALTYLLVNDILTLESQQEQKAE